MTSEELIRFLRDEGHDPEPYSGRWMYGKQCVSVTVERDDALWNIAKTSGLAGLDLDAPTTDSMGSGTVLYWPRLAWPEDA